MLSNKEMLDLIEEAEDNNEIVIDQADQDIIVCDSDCDGCSLVKVCEQLSETQDYPTYLKNVTKLFEGAANDTSSTDEAT